MTNQKQVRASLWQTFPSLELHALKWGVKTAPQNRHNAETRTAFVDFVDYLQKSEQITETLANRATL